MSDMLLYILIALAAIQLLLLLQLLGAVRGRGGAGSERMAAMKLAEQARALYAKAVTFPPTLLGPGGDRQLRMATLWTADEVQALKPATPILASICGEIYGETEAALTWLLQQGSAVRDKPAGQGQVFVDFPHEKWKANYEAAIDGLHLLETYGEVTAKVAAG